MTELIEKYFELENITAITVEKLYDQISYDEYIRVLDEVIKNDESFGVDDELKDSIMWYSNEYMSFFVPEVQKGFSIEWSRAVAYSCVEMDGKDAAAHAYLAVYKKSPEQALEDLKLFAQLNLQDELFIKRFVDFFELEQYVFDGLVYHAEDYSRKYKEQIAEGKSDLFADRYASLAEGAGIHYYFYSFCVASEYEKAILNGYSTLYALTFSEEIAEFIVNHFHSYDEALADEYFEDEKERLEDKHHHLKYKEI